MYLTLKNNAINNNKMDCKIILLIMNCKKYSFKAETQKKTWLQKLPSYLKYYHVVGCEEMEQSFFFDDESKILLLKTADDYNSLPKKVISAYEAVFTKYPDTDYIFKTDDDQMVNTVHFFDVISKTLNSKINACDKIHYGGFVVDVPKPYLSQYHRVHPELPEYLPIYATKYCSGRFYLLSKEAIDNLLLKKDKICSLYLEDYAIGFHLDEKFKKNIFQLQTQKYFNDMNMS